MVLRGGEVFCFFVLRDVEDSVFKGEFWNTGEGGGRLGRGSFPKTCTRAKSGFSFSGAMESQCA